MDNSRKEMQDFDKVYDLCYQELLMEGVPESQARLVMIMAAALTIDFVSSGAPVRSPLFSRALEVVTRVLAISKEKANDSSTN